MTTPSVDYSFSFNGYLFGGIGQGVQVLQVDGLEDLPSLRVQDDNRGYFDGMFTGRDFLNSRVITMQLQVMSDQSNSMFTYLNQLKAAIVSQTSGVSPLQFKIPTRDFVQKVQARVRRRAITIDPNYSYGKAIVHVEFFCPDPRIYADTGQQVQLGTSTGFGRTYNRNYTSGGGFSYTVSTGVLSNYQTVYNYGNTTTYPTITIVGGCTNPSITDQTTGQVLSFNTTLTASDVLTIDTDTRQVLLNGLSARNLMSNSSSWFSFPSGGTTVSFIATASTIDTTCVVSWADAYL
jgi:hypothetical protein